MTTLAKRVLELMPDASKQFALELYFLDNSEKVIQLLCEYEYTQVLADIFGEERAQRLISEYSVPVA